MMDRDSAAVTVAASAESKRFPSGRAWWVALGIVFAVGAFSLLFRLEKAKSLGSHEGYAIVPAREMLLSGDYIVPRFGEMPRLKKPPLIYWSVIAAAQATGTLDIGTARLPAALAALLLGGLMARWAWRWYGTTAAIGAAAAQLTSVYVLVFGRKVEADILLVLLISTALWLVVGQAPGESRRTTFLRWVGIWACAAVSWLGKFHFGPAMIFAPAIAWIVLERRWRSLFGLVNPVGLLLFAAAAGIWPALVLQRMPEAWQVWQEETIGRAVGELGRQPAWFYLPHLATWTLPWTIFAVLAWPASWRAAFGGLRQALRASGVEGNPSPLAPLPRGEGNARAGLRDSIRRVDSLWRSVFAQGDARERFLWVWLGVTFAIVTVSANKHPHYILPALPAFSLWTARRFAQLAEQARAGERLLSRPLAMGVSIVSAAALAAAVAGRGRLPVELPFATVLALVCSIAMGLAGVAWLLYGRWNRAAAGMAAATWVIAFGVAADALMPQTDHRAGAYRFALEAREREGSNVELGVYGMDQDAAVWYLGEPVFRAEAPAQIAARLKESSRLRLVTTAERERELSRLGELRVVERFADRPGEPVVELGHYRQMVLVEIGPHKPNTAVFLDKSSRR